MTLTRPTAFFVALTLTVSALTATDAVAQSGNLSRECTIIDVAIHSDRVSIQCGAKGGKVGSAKSYAVAIDSPMAPLLLDLGLATLKRKVKIYYTDDTSGNPPGCLPANCRQLNGIVAFER